MTALTVLLFDDFTALDFIGPVEALQRLDGCQVRYCSLEGGPVSNRSRLTILTQPLSEVQTDILLVPGGMGTRKAVLDRELLSALSSAAERSRFCLTVCTGSALLGATGLLDGLPATSNKFSFSWVVSAAPKVLWNPAARWVRSGKFYTSSGVSAGMDMAFGFITDQYGPETAAQIAARMEYIPNSDPDSDPFAVTVPNF